LLISILRSNYTPKKGQKKITLASFLAHYSWNIIHSVGFYFWRIMQHASFEAFAQMRFASQRNEGQK
jgi:hypothetical protein